MKTESNEKLASAVVEYIYSTHGGPGPDEYGNPWVDLVASVGDGSGNPELSFLDRFLPLVLETQADCGLTIMFGARDHFIENPSVEEVLADRASHLAHRNEIIAWAGANLT